MCGVRLVLVFVRVRVRMRMLVNVFALVMKWVRVMLARILGLAIHDDINFGRADAAAATRVGGRSRAGDEIGPTCQRRGRRPARC